MEESKYLEKFEESRLVSENYFSYISRQRDAQKEEVDGLSKSLDSVVQEVRAAGVVSTLAAQEALKSHNKTFTILAAIARAQDYLAQLVTDIREGGGVGNGGIGGFLEDVITGMGTMAMAHPLIAGILSVVLPAAPQFTLPAAITIGAVLGGTKFIVNSLSKAKEKRMSKSTQNNAQSASALAREIAEETAVERNNPRSSSNAPYTFSGAVALQTLEPPTVVVPNPSTGVDETTEIYNMQTHVSAMQPQSVQVAAQFPVTDNTPNQTITLNVHNEFRGIPQDRRMLDNIGEYLAGQIHDKLNSGAPLSAPGW